MNEYFDGVMITWTFDDARMIEGLFSLRVLRLLQVHNV